MAFIPAVNVAEVVLMGVVADQDMFNVFNFLYPTDPDIVELDALATLVASSWSDNLAPHVASAYILGGVRATSLTTDSSPATEFFPSSGNVGEDGDPPVPLNVATCVSWYTALRGRSFRGRTYFGAYSRLKMADAGHITTLYQSQLITAFTAFISDIEFGRSNNHVLVSRQHNGSVTSPAAVEPITSMTINREVDSMRRRLVGRGS